MKNEAWIFQTTYKTLRDSLIGDFLLFEIIGGMLFFFCVIDHLSLFIFGLGA
jgi:hypothetical protein